MKKQTSIWLHNLIAAVITGGSTTALSVLGIAAADAVGIAVPTLDFKQAGVLFLSGAVVGLLSYLKQSPLPNDTYENDPKL